MKKSTKIIISIAAVIILALIICGIVWFVKLNKEKTSISASEFYSKMTNKGYNVQDVKSQFAEYSYIKKAYVALSKDYSYQIEFYELDNSEFTIEITKVPITEFETLVLPPDTLTGLLPFIETES